MKWIKSYESFKQSKLGYQSLLEAILSIDKNIENSLQSIKNDKTSVGSFAKIAGYILDFLGKDLTKLKYDSVYVNPEKDDKFPLKAKMGKQENQQKIQSVITNIIESIFNQNPNLPKYFVKKKGTSPVIPELGTFLTEEEYKKIMSNFTKEDLEANKKLHPQVESKFIIDNLAGANVIDDFSRLLSVKLESFDKSVISGQDIRIVSGDDIMKWYDKKNTEEVEGTDLNKSCMTAYEGRNEFMKFYAVNKDKIQLVIKVNDEGLLVARALLWKLDYSEKGFEYFMDRCYFNYPEDPELIFVWLKTEGGYNNINKKTSVEVDDVMIVKLEQVLVASYPYLDTFRFLFINHDKEKYAEVDNIYYIDIDDILVNQGFLSNLSYISLIERFPDPFKLKDYVDFRLSQTDGSKSVVRGLGEIKDTLGKDPNDRPGVPILIITGPKKSAGFLPATSYENELKNAIKMNKMHTGAGSEKDLIQIEEIGEYRNRKEIPEVFSSNGLDFNEFEEIGQGAYVHQDNISLQINSQTSLESVKGFRLWVYDISDLKKDTGEIGQILRGEKKFGGKKYLTPADGLVKNYISALDCELLGIDVSKRKVEFSQSYYIFGSSLGYNEYKPDPEFDNIINRAVNRPNWNPNNDAFFEAYLKEKNLMTPRNKQLLELRKEIDESL